jgi:hypothetical protein
MIKVFAILFIITSVQCADNNNRKGPAPLQNRVKAMKVNYPYSFFNADSKDWRTSSPIFSEELTKSKSSYAKLSRAQDHEDLWLYENWFYGMKNGVIIESGALDGVKYSTTFMFEFYADWTPIHIGLLLG